MIYAKMNNYITLKSISYNHKSIARQIILSHKNVDTINQLLVLVEGYDDRDVYQTFFANNKVDIKDCLGCDAVISVHKTIKKETKWKYISILDSDFKRLDKFPRHDINMFFTDWHDSEILMVHFEPVIKAVMNNILGRIPKYDIKKRLYNELYYVSLLKWFNMHRHFSYTFKDLDLAHESWGLQISEATVLQHMVPSKKSPKAFPSKPYNKFKKAHPNPDFDQITNGHDFISRWSAILKNEHQTQYSDHDFRDLVCAAFTIKYAAKTQLYANIKAWCKNNSFDVMAQ